MHNLEFMKGELSIRQPAEVWRRKPWRTHRQRATSVHKNGAQQGSQHLVVRLQLQRSERDLLSSQDLAWQGKCRRRGERRTFGHQLDCGQTHWRPAQQANIIVQSATLKMMKRAVQEPDKGATKIRNDGLNEKGLQRQSRVLR